MIEQQNIDIKQRIIGAIVLVSLGVIIIPMLLNGGRFIDTSHFSGQSISGNNIPDMPKSFNRVLPDIPQPARMPAAKSINAYPQRSLPKASEQDKKNASKIDKVTQTKQRQVSKPTSTKINLAYTLQIASFSQESNADALQSKLRKKNYKAYIESTMTADGKVYRLRVGPYLKFEQISTIKEQIEKQFKLKNTFIVKY